MKPLGEYVCLKLERVLESADSDEPIPFILRRLVSREYNVGPEGAVIGTSSDYGVCTKGQWGMCEACGDPVGAWECWGNVVSISFCQKRVETDETLMVMDILPWRI